MIEMMFVQIAGILLIGDKLNSILRRYFTNPDFEQSLLDRAIISIILGYASFVMPMVIVGVLFENVLHYVVFIHYTIGLILLVRFILNKILSINNVRLKLPEFTFGERVFFILIVSLSSLYLLYQIIYYERGWDALQFYFPNALYIYLYDSIPTGVNPFSFFPTFKPPLNVMYITYSMFVTKGYPYHSGANLHPWVLLMGTLLVVIQLTQQLTGSRYLSFFAGYMFLISPFTYYLMYEYAYYQDIPVMFFMIASIYFLSKDTPSYFAFIASISASLAILSKISGYTILYLVFMSFIVIRGHKVYSFLKYLIFLAITAFLAYNAAFDLYVGYSVIVILLGAYVLYLLLQNDQQQIKIQNIILFGLLPILFGIFWFWFMNKQPQITDFLTREYISTEHSSIITQFELITDPYAVYIENGMSVSFTASILYILTGGMMGLFYSIPKLFVLFRRLDMQNNRLLCSLKIYLFSFLMLWFTYYGRTSGRYLSPIHPVLIVFTAIGFHALLKHFNQSNEKLILYFFFASTGGLFYFPFIPLENLVYDVNTRFYLYHKNQLILFLYLIVFWIILIQFIKKSYSMQKSNYRKFSKVFIIFVFLAFASPQISMYIYSGFSTEEFNSQMNFSHRPAFEELIEWIDGISLELEDVIISVNTPGLGYYTTRSNIDLMVIGLSGEFDEIYNYNDTEILDFVYDYNISIIIHLNEQHFYYNTFQENYVSRNIMQIALNTEFFALYNYNEEFVLYLLN
ncbi:MAG: hypothetical protein INQ03_18385 [Candidatus Heimdallarchaeota archaeon]|nr:hypothetical protein [Candidatus Heimdallarchaeota archaeon]